jgi:hypothetical protein
MATNRARAKLQKFKPVFTAQQVRTMDANYSESWGFCRQLVMTTLTRTADQLAEGMRDADGDAVSQLLGQFDDFIRHCLAGIELAETASARVLAVAGSKITPRTPPTTLSQR